MKKSTNGAKSIRVFLVDDHPLEALQGIASAEPDLAIVDLRLRSSDGLELVRDLRDRHPKVLSLVLSMQDESITAERAVRAGARGYISKQEAPSKIIQAVRKVLGGEIYWSEKAAALVASKIASPSRPASSSAVDHLSERELQVFEHIGQGHNTNQIADSLHIDVSTVETYRSRIKEKLNLKSGSELLQTAIRWYMARDSH